MLTRIISALCLIPLVIATIFLAPRPLFALIVNGICTFALWEFLRLGDTIFSRIPPWFTLVFAFACGGLVVHPWFEGHAVLGLVLFVLTVSTLAVARSRAPGEVLVRAVWPAMGFFYLFLFFSYVIDIRFGLRPEIGAALLVFFLCFQWVGDTLAYFVGRTLGRHPLAPAISPKKTIEGTFGGLLGSALVGVALSFTLFDGRAPLAFAGFGIAMGGLGQLGDLLESQFKRTAGVKDSSNLIPGHGGVLDRIDSLILTAPVFYFCLKLFF